MIRFVNKDGVVFDGVPPYVHWFDGQQSIDLIYSRTIWILSDNETLDISIESDQNIFKLVDTSSPLTEHSLDYNEITTLDPITVTGVECSGKYLHQIIVTASSAEAGEYKCKLTITESGSETDIWVGVDFYSLDETLSINLGNRGTEIPELVQKAILSNNIHESNIDSILINRKFKELISNYLDIMDCRGSYGSLYNSLKWFEWGDTVKLYEIWKRDGRYLEKPLELILAPQFETLLTSHTKTTHLALVASLFKTTDELDEEKNPVIERIAYDWSIEDLSVKVGLLGAFYERYFMPIHLDLKRATLESLVYTISVKCKYGTIPRPHAWFDDTGVVDIIMDTVNVLGNVEWAGIDKDTVFGEYYPYSWSDYGHTGRGCVSPYYKMTYVNDNTGTGEGPDPDIEKSNWAQIYKGTGVIIPVTVRVPLPKGDGINNETLITYDYNYDTSLNPVQFKHRAKEKRLWMSTDHPYTVTEEDEEGRTIEVTKHNWYAEFTFYILENCVCRRSISLLLHSLSGHTWTAAAGYEVIDTSGSYLDIFKMRKTMTDDYFAEHPLSTGAACWDDNNVFARSQYPTISVDSYTGTDIDPSKYHPKTFAQYIPYDASQSYDDPGTYFTVIVENTGTDYFPFNEDFPTSQFALLYAGTSYRRTRLNKCVFIPRGPLEACSWTGTDCHKYGIIILPEEYYWSTIWQPVLDNYINGVSGMSGAVPHPNCSYTYRIEKMYIPQLMTGELIKPTTKSSISDITFTNADLICVVPQFNMTFGYVNEQSIKWKFTNKTTQETIEYTVPVTTPLVADNVNKSLTPGYWSIEMQYRVNSAQILNYYHYLRRDSAFIIKEADPPEPGPE